MSGLLALARETPLARWTGRVAGVHGAIIEVAGLHARLGDLCSIEAHHGPAMAAEVIGLKPDKAIVMPYGPAIGIGLGDTVVASAALSGVPVGGGMVGRVLDAFGMPMDGGPPIAPERRVPLRPPPLNPLSRPAIGRQLQTGVRAIDSFLSLGRGQRMGIFAGSGVGKSTLLGMLARTVESDINVVALIGERGREVREFLESHLGAAGLARSVLVVATSDQPAVVRARAALCAMAIAEHFRDAGRNVFLMMDSVTRFAMARREIDLAAGQPPTARGYTPGVFGEIPSLCERAGTAASNGAITAVFTVLVEGDDHNEPVADTLRATLDGHIVLTRSLAHEGHYPAIDVLQSVSRIAPALLNADQQRLQESARASLAVYERYREMIEMGLYKPGSSAEIDAAHAAARRINGFLRQARGETTAAEASWSRLKQAVETPP